MIPSDQLVTSVPGGDPPNVTPWHTRPRRPRPAADSGRSENAGQGRARPAPAQPRPPRQSSAAKWRAASLPGGAGPPSPAHQSHLVDIEDSTDIQVVALKLEAGAGAKHDVSHDDQSPAGCSGAVCGRPRSNTAHPAGGRPSHRTPQLPTATTTHHITTTQQQHSE